MLLSIWSITQKSYSPDRDPGEIGEHFWLRFA
jgi:hypothetical protein